MGRAFTRALVATALLMTLVATPATAAPSQQPTALTWVGGNGPSWSTAANWSPARAPNDGDSLKFPDSPTPASTNDLAGLALAAIDITGPGVSLSGNGISLAGGITATGIGPSPDGGPSDRVALDMSLPPGSHRFAGAMVLSGTISGGGDVVVAFPAAPQDLTSAGVVLTGPSPNTYTGNTVVEARAKLELYKPPGMVAIPNGRVTVRPGSAPQPGSLLSASPLQLGRAVTVTAPNQPGLASGTFQLVPSAPSPPAPFERVGPVEIGPGGGLALGLMDGDHYTPPQYPPAAVEAMPVLAADSLSLSTALFTVNLYDGRNAQVQVTGPVDLGSSRLNLFVDGSTLPATGVPLTIVANDGTAPVTGTFTGLAEGQVSFTGGCCRGTSANIFYRISYRGGDGNDVTVTPIDAAEFQVRFGYQVLLDRTPDSGGFTYWNGFIRGGGDPAFFTRSLTYSREGRGRVVKAAYVELLGRPADPGGLSYWTEVVSRGGRVDELEAALLGSAEYAAQPGRTSTAGFVDSVYRDPTVLARPVDPGGLSYWAGLIDSRARTRAQVALALLRSDESAQVNVSRISAVFPPLRRPSTRVYRFLGGDFYATASEALAQLG